MDQQTRPHLAGSRVVVDAVAIIGFKLLLIDRGLECVRILWRWWHDQP
jgi:hypothetical protein